MEWLAVPGGVLVLAVLIAFRWLALLSRRVIRLAERVAWLEGRASIHPEETDES